MRIVAFLLMLAMSAGPVLAQRERGEGFKPPPGKASPDERRRDFDRERERRDTRPERMRPEEREKLRRDIEDANRNLHRRR